MAVTTGHPQPSPLSLNVIERTTREKYVSRINHIHFKDIRKEVLENALNQNLSFRESFLNGVFTVPGDGCIEYKNILNILYQNGYNKWLVAEAEQDPKKANPLKYAKIGFN